MKRTLIIIALLAWAVEAGAQGTMQFNATLAGTNEVPPNTDPTIATGTFSLSGSTLNFVVNVPAVTFISMSGYIQGPAPPGSNGPIIFDLGGPVFHSGGGLGEPPYYAFFSPMFGPFGAGPFTLTDSQISELESGLWYVNITSAQQPDGQLRGQIFLVPEPSTFALLVFSGATFWFLRRRR